jgi:hypothetical protein
MEKWRNGETAEWRGMAEWQNGRNGYQPTTFMVHTNDNDTDTNTDTDTL